MKKRVITGLLVGLLLATGLTSCGSKEEKEDKKDTTSIVDTTTSTSKSTSTSTSTSTVTSTSTQTSTVTTSQQSAASLVKEYFSSLIQIENATAYDYLPDAMQPDYEPNSVDNSDISYDFTNFTNVSSINHAGYGEQWQMVVENINQSVIMSKVFNVAQTALNSAGGVVESYIDNSYADVMSHTFSGDSYNASFAYGNNLLSFNISLTSSVTVPVIGTVQPIIKMKYDLENDIKQMYISLGDVYKIKYTVSDNVYEMATTYGVTILGQTGSRSSYLVVNNNNNKTTGHIYEYTTINGNDIAACADFYIENGYVSVVGNKASGMVAFTGYINELYKANEGRLLGYEVQETLSAVKYNTLWFNLWDISGISNLKTAEKTDLGSYDKRTIDVYLNNSTTLFEPTYNTKLTVRTSRKYDIEYRSRFYYTKDSENEKYVSNEVLVPMMFIQAGDNFNSFKNDILNDNNIDASVNMNQTDLNKILTDYENLITIFIQNKDNMSSAEIINYINNN